MESIKRKSEKALAYLNKWPKESCTKAYFSIDPNMDNVCKNTCGSFNSRILKYRIKLIMTMAKMPHYEDNKCKQSKVGKQNWLHCSMQQSRLDKIKRESNQWTPIFISKGRLQVANNWRTHVDVDLDAQTCTCRM